MTISKELWRCYTRIFFVELAYWVVSIGMVFINKNVLSDQLLVDDLTVFITIFQILFSLSILITLNRITKNYLIPKGYDEIKLLDEDCESNTGLVELNDKKQSISVSVSSDNLIDNGLKESTNAVGENRNKIEGEAIIIKTGMRRNNGNNDKGNNTNRGHSDQDGLLQLLIVDIPGRINLETCKIVLPLSIFYTGMLLLNNFCLKKVGVAFYFVSRSLTTVFNVLFTYLLINEPVSRGALVCCGFIVLGFILGIDQESVIGSLSVIGVIFGVGSSLFTSLFSIYTKKTLAKLDRNIWTIVLYNNINAIVLCTPLLLVHGDLEALVSDRVVSATFWLLLSISGVMAFFISIVTNASIKYTSPLTHTISGTAKSCLQTVIAVIYYNDHKSALWWLSNVTILIASALYSRIRQKEMERKALGGGGAGLDRHQDLQLARNFEEDGSKRTSEKRREHYTDESSSELDETSRVDSDSVLLFSRSA